MPSSVSQLAARVMSGEVRAAARACRIVDEMSAERLPLLKALYPASGRAWLVGVTGVPGAGKSTLTNRLIKVFRERDKRVGVVAVDPTSPFSGGAILGDRIRMQDHFEDPEVFIRSLATRGALGGLSRSALDVARILEAWGAEIVLLETVGVGQDELEITQTAHSTLVVMAPGMGDDVQAIKAGILECADVFAVNKADRSGADATVRDLEVMLALGRPMIHSTGPGHVGAKSLARPAPADSGHWQVPVIKCVATRGQGIEGLVLGLERHREWLLTTPAGKTRQRERARLRLLSTFRDALTQAAVSRLGDELERLVERVQQRELDPYSACEDLVKAFSGSG